MRETKKGKKGEKGGATKRSIAALRRVEGDVCEVFVSLSVNYLYLQSTLTLPTIRP
jgi:hypothetical protein